MAALRDGRIDASKLESEVLRLDALPARFPELVANRDTLIKVIVDFSAEGAA
jgi:threonine dehydrogenase-like Zn-dependent dehydrogenase